MDSFTPLQTVWQKLMLMIKGWLPASGDNPQSHSIASSLRQLARSRNNNGNSKDNRKDKEHYGKSSR